MAEPTTLRRKITELRIIQLKSELKRRHLEITGPKTALLSRLQQAIEAEGGDPENIEIPAAAESAKKISKMKGEKRDALCDASMEDDAATKDDESDHDGGDEKQALEEAAENEEGDDESAEETHLPETDEEDENKTAAGPGDGPQESVEDAEPAAPEDTEASKSVTEEEDNLSVTVQAEDVITLDCDGDDLLETGKNVKPADAQARKSVAAAKESQSAKKDGVLDSQKDSKKESAKGGSVRKEARESSSKKTGSGDKEKDSVKKAFSAGASGQAKSTTKDSKESRSSKEDKVITPGSSGSPTRNLWVSGLTKATKAGDLKNIFLKYGKVLIAKILTNARNPGAKCYGIVTMLSSGDVPRCILHLHHTQLHGQQITVEKLKNESLQNVRYAFNSNIFSGDKRSSGSEKRSSGSEKRSLGSSENKPAGSSEKKSAGSSEKKSAGSSEKKPAGGSEKKPAGSSEKKPAGSSEKKPAGGSEKKPAGGSEKKPAGGSEKKPTGGSEKKPTGGNEKKPAGGSEKKPTGGSEKKPTGGSEKKPTGGSEKKSAGSSEKKPAGGSEKKPTGGSEEKPEGADNASVVEENAAAEEMPTTCDKKPADKATQAQTSKEKQSEKFDKEKKETQKSDAKAEKVRSGDAAIQDSSKKNEDRKRKSMGSPGELVVIDQTRSERLRPRPMRRRIERESFRNKVFQHKMKLREFQGRTMVMPYERIKDHRMREHLDHVDRIRRAVELRRRREMAERERRERMMREQEIHAHLQREREQLEIERQKLERERMERERLERERARIEKERRKEAERIDRERAELRRQQEQLRFEQAKRNSLKRPRDIDHGREITFWSNNKKIALSTDSRFNRSSEFSTPQNRFSDFDHRGDRTRFPDNSTVPVTFERYDRYVAQSESKKTLPGARREEAGFDQYTKTFSDSRRNDSAPQRNDIGDANRSDVKDKDDRRTIVIDRPVVARNDSRIISGTDVHGRQPRETGTPQQRVKNWKAETLIGIDKRALRGERTERSGRDIAGSSLRTIPISRSAGSAFGTREGERELIVIERGNGSRIFESRHVVERPARDLVPRKEWHGPNAQAVFAETRRIGDGRAVGMMVQHASNTSGINRGFQVAASPLQQSSGSGFKQFKSGLQRRF